LKFLIPLEEGRLFAQADLSNILWVAAFLAIGIGALFIIALVFRFGSLWFQALMSGADISLTSLVTMSLCQVNPAVIVAAKIMGVQAGLSIHRTHGMSTAKLEAHALAGGDVMQVVRAIIVAQRAGIDLDFDRATAIDLAGRNVLDAVRTSVSPKVIDCPDPKTNGNRPLSAVAKNGVELLIHARVTVRTNLDQLIGGATEETIIARVGEGIVSAIGSAQDHMDVMEVPNSISKGILLRGLDANTAFEIVSIDIVDIDIGQNIGARLQTDQAEADTRMARAHAEVRLAIAIACQQEMKARLVANLAELIRAEAEVPLAMAEALRRGQFYIKRPLSENAARPPGLKPPIVLEKYL
jgi:uncharacterized protein YqfA (UPF0365 family)